MMIDVLPLQSPFSPLVVGIVILAIWAFLIVIWFIPLRLYLAAKLANAPVTLLELVEMRYRRIPPALIVEPYIALRSMGVPIDLKTLQTHFLAGGDCQRVTKAIQKARRAGIELDFIQAAALDLSTQDILETVDQWIRELPSE